VYRREAEGQRCREFRDMLDQREQERQGHSVSRVSGEPVSKLDFYVSLVGCLQRSYRSSLFSNQFMIDM
jgi:hypothetical protein